MIKHYRKKYMHWQQRASLAVNIIIHGFLGKHSYAQYK